SHTVLSTLSLHDALPICRCHKMLNRIGIVSEMVGIDRVIFASKQWGQNKQSIVIGYKMEFFAGLFMDKINSSARQCIAFIVYYRSEEHTSELQSRENLVC